MYIKNVLINLVLFIILISINSCQPKVDFPFEDSESKLVIWSLLYPDSVVTATLSKTSPPLSKNVDRRIRNAIVILFENKIAVDTLKEDSVGFYKSHKGFKPNEGKIYQLISIKEGFKTLKTPQDTMPFKPIVSKIIFEDSVGINQGNYVARITLFTNTPSHFANFGFGKFKSEGLPTDTAFGGILKSNTTFTQEGNSTCEDNGFIKFPNFVFIAPNCKYSNTIYELNNSFSSSLRRYLGKAKFYFTICSITYKSVEIIKALEKLSTQYTDDYFSGVNLFWVPVQLPNYIENGYGFFACYNTTDVKIH